MDNMLPPIKEMYNSTRENRDFYVIRKYQDMAQSPSTKKSPTKKGHYLDDQVKASCSPGPASSFFKLFRQVKHPAVMGT